MSQEYVRAVVLDSRLTPEAVRVLLYVATLGPVGDEIDVKGEDLAILLHGGEKPIRAAIKRAEHCGYLEARFAGRAGTKMRLLRPVNDAPQGEAISEMTPPRGRQLINDAPQGVISGGNDAPQGGNSGASTTTTSTPGVSTPTGARPSDGDLDRLALYLGEHASAVHQMLDSAAHPPNWVAAVLGKYGPTGTQLRLMAGIPPDRRPAVLATAMIEWATAGKPFTNRHFDGFMRKAVEGERESGRSGERGSTGAQADRAPLRVVGGGRGSWDIEE